MIKVSAHYPKSFPRFRLFRHFNASPARKRWMYRRLSGGVYLGNYPGLLR